MAQVVQGVTELQRTSVVRMLNLVGPGEQTFGNSQTWKVLVYDKFCQEIIAPLLKVGSLRNHGVTLHLGLNNERLPVADVPAVYFVEPTAENVQKICDDLAKGLYESCYVNFASAVPRPLLEELARGALRANAAPKVSAVVDRYCSFVSLSPSLFSLNLPCAYSTLHSPSIADHAIQRYVERIVDGLLSVLVTMRQLPVIRCPPGEVAEMVSRSLEGRIRELLARGGAQAAELFSGAAVGADTTSQRPLLCITDRDMDLVTMLNHTWTYQAMAHDVLNMKLNRLTVAVDETEGSSGAPPKAKSYDVDESDAFWVKHAGEPFPAVANAVHEEIQNFNKKRSEMSGGGEDSDSTGAMNKGLTDAINALPEMTEKKRSIDMHTNIATAMLNEVKARELDRYYEMEDNFASQSLGTSVSQLLELMKDPQRGTIADKTRALMALYLSKPSITSAQLQSLIDALSGNGGDSAGVAYLQHLASIRSMSIPSLVGNPTASGSTSAGSLLGGAMLGGLADKMRKGGEGLLTAGMNNIKNIVTSKKDLLVCQVLDSLMEQKVTELTQNYLYLDPKAAPSMGGGEGPRIRAPFRKGIAFVVGGGNYTEMQSVQEWAQAHGRQVAYGSTDMVSPVQFVEELRELGQHHSK